MDDIYKINKYQLGLGKKDSLNDKNLVSKTKLEQVLLDDSENINQQTLEWGKMAKTSKLKKIKTFSQEYINRIGENAKDISCDELLNLEMECWNFLRDAIDKKRLNNKDIEYDSKEGVIKNIRPLVFNNDVKRFALNKTKTETNIANTTNKRMPPKFELKK